MNETSFRPVMRPGRPALGSLLTIWTQGRQKLVPLDSENDASTERIIAEDSPTIVANGHNYPSIKETINGIDAT